MGVPQGSILDPSTVYIMDLLSLMDSIEHEIVLFSDDTSFLFKVRTHYCSYDIVTNAISNVVDWSAVINL